MTQGLKVFDATMPAPREYYGYSATYLGFDEFAREYEKYVEIESREIIRGNIDCQIKWLNNNSFQVIIDLETKEICGLRDFGRYNPKPSDFLLKTKYLPVFQNPGNMFEEDKTLDAIRVFDDELRKAEHLGLSAHKKPVFLTRFLGDNDYEAWSVDENLPINVYGYKRYRDTFGVTSPDRPNYINFNHNYIVYMPSVNFINLVMLDLYPYTCTHMLPDDTFFSPRPLMEEKENVIKNISPYDALLYKRAISVLNNTRFDKAIINTPKYQKYLKLESRIDRFENLVMLGAPDLIIQREYDLIFTVLKDIDPFLDEYVISN